MRMLSRSLMCAFMAVLMMSSLAFAYQERVKVVDIKGHKIIVKRDNGAKFELWLGNGCSAIRNYEKRDVIFKAQDKFLGRNSRIELPFEGQQCAVASYAKIKGANENKNGKHNERVRVIKVRSSHAVIQRDNGVRFKIRVGAGCPSLWRYEGRYVRIKSPYGFLGDGSDLFIKDVKQQCRIRSYERQ